MEEILNTEINDFLMGRDPMERIVNIECGYMDDTVSIIFYDEKNNKKLTRDNFYPFIWANQSIARKMFGGDKNKIQEKLRLAGIGVKGLKTNNGDGILINRLEQGYRVLFYAKEKMSYNKFLSFFKSAGTPVFYNEKDKKPYGVTGREFLQVSPVEQYMIKSGKRLFKGYEEYDEINRFQFDLETEGLNPEKHGITQIGIRTNRGYEKIISILGHGEEKLKNELSAIKEFIRIINNLSPDVIAGHNSENFDWQFLITRCEILGTSMEELTIPYFKKPLYKKKKKTILKLGGEIEYYNQTILWGFHIVDSMHAVRRAQAIDSNIKKANLKYITKYSKLEKKNRIYIQGEKIQQTWEIKDKIFALNNANGDWYLVTDKKPLVENYEMVSGEYIAERYLLDDLYETDKVECMYNESNFLINKFLPTTFSRACTMGTAGIWKLIMLAWSYENNLAIPAFDIKKRFTGGLSRLLRVGYVANVVKLDYNSLYPAIILTWMIQSKLDITNAMLKLLDYVLTQREKYKELKSDASAKIKRGKKALETETAEDRIKLIKQKIGELAIIESKNDKKQLPLKIFGNSFFGGFGAQNLFNWGDVNCAEKTTCIGRQSLRLMISWFTKLGYNPIVGDTDGFNFQQPQKNQFRYTEENPYIGKGLNRNTKLGEKYTGVSADVAEFNDLFMRGKMGLGIDEYADATINFSRKNYADLLENGKTKKVGNTIKSKKMPVYIEKFLDVAIDQLLYNNGKDFLRDYYSYIDNIYNYRIPLRDIASKGKIKMPLSEYKKACKEVTKSGSKKSRQAWYELAIINNLKVDVGDVIYYINCGESKSESDVKRLTKYFQFLEGVKTDVTKLVTKHWNIYKRELKKETPNETPIKLNEFVKTERCIEVLGKENIFEEDEIILNCVLLPNKIVEADEDTFCDEDTEYNVVKYIEQFNKRIKPLTVCFDKSIRDKVLINNPENTQYFTDEQSVLVSGQPFKESDQDTYEQLMTMERKEVEFWLKINEIPPFIEECHLDWDSLVNQYKEIIERENDELFQSLNEKYLKAIDKITNDEINYFLEDYILPKSLENLVQLDLSKNDNRFYFIQIPDMTPSTGGYFMEDFVYNIEEYNDDELFVNNDEF